MMRSFSSILSAVTLVLVCGTPAFSQDEPDDGPEEDTCKEEFWTLKGNVRKDVERFDKFIKDLAASKDAVGDINSYLKKNGLPQQMALSAGEKISVANRVEGGEDSPGGPFAVVFLKKLEAKKGAGLTLDKVFEVESPSAKTEIRNWNVPFEFPGVAAADGDEIIYQEDLNAICGDGGKKVDIAVKPNGEYRILSVPKFKKMIKLKGDKCKAGGHLFPGATYPECVEVEDLKSGKKRYFVWELPMT
jgi:hypothetical protein